MILRTVLAALAISLLSPAFAKADDTIASIRDPKRDYVLEGDVVTIWEDSFLFDDGTAKVIVDIRPYTTRGLDLAGRDYLQITGHLSPNNPGVLIPLVLQEGRTGNTVMFGGTAMLPPLSLTEVMRNTVRYRLPEHQDRASVQQRASNSASTTTGIPNMPPANQPVPDVNQAINSAYQEYAASVGSNALPPPNLPSNTQSNNTNTGGSTGSSPTPAVQPVGSGGGSAAPTSSRTTSAPASR